MEKIPPLALLLHSFPEAILVSTVSVVLMGIRPYLGKAAAFGAVQAVTAYFVRQLPLPFGLHTLLYIFAGAVYLVFLYKLPFRKALLAMVAALLLLILAEGIVITMLLKHTLLTLDVILAPENALLRVLVALPQMLFLAAVAYVAYLARGKRLEDYRPLRHVRHGRY